MVILPDPHTATDILTDHDAIYSVVDSDPGIADTGLDFEQVS